MGNRRAEDESKSVSPNNPSPIDPNDVLQGGTVSLLAGKTAVVVEDEGITLLQLRRALTRAGLKVVGTAGNGEEGVQVVLRERPDLVIMDIKMPVMNGIEAARRILETYSVCIVMLTAFATEEYRDEAREAGACGYLLKPVTSATLLPQLESAYGKFHEEGSPQPPD